ncbi:MAG: MBL fold metallo-hydrolase [Planctomycetaceae bacterium]|nr:MBL fold metallo-hydrolase [Planctomycetaceae bacterium]
MTTTSRRSFLTAAAGVGLSGFLPGSLRALGAELDGGTTKQKPSASMVVETVFTEGLAQLSYLIGDKATGKAAVIDPRRDVDVYVELARKHKLSITHALETHIHADLVSGCQELADLTGTAKVYVSAEGGAEYGFSHEKLRDGDKIDLGRVILTAKHTPGHTPEHLSYLAEEGNRPGRPFAVFSGDCLFADSVGRPDLLGDDKSDKLAKELFHSVRDFFLKLDDDVRVHPGHGAGSPCGANISDRLVTTIGYERQHNPALQFADEAKFVEYVLFNAPPEPRYYKRMKQVNAKGPEVLGRLPTCPALPPKVFEQAVDKSGVQLVDNRQMLGFGGSHIAGALNIGPRAELSIWAGWLLEPEQPIFLVLPKDTDLPEVQRQLLRVGYTRFGGYLLGGMEEWENKALPLTPLAQMPVHDLKKELPPSDLQVLDVRTPGEWQDGHVPGATYIFLPELEKKLDRLDKAKPVAVYCDSGYRASIAASLLMRHEFTQVRNVPGSWKAWKAAGYEVEKPKMRKKASETDLS